MSTFTHPIKLANPSRPAQPVALDALVDTGAFFTSVPASRLSALGLSPAFSRPFLIANGQVITRGCCEAIAHINGETRNTIVIFADENSPVLLGAYTLEGFALGVDPVNRKLIPLPVLPMC